MWCVLHTRMEIDVFGNGALLLRLRVRNIDHSTVISCHFEVFALLYRRKSPRNSYKLIIKSWCIDALTKKKQRDICTHARGYV